MTRSKLETTETSKIMQLKTVWQQGSTNPENANNFAAISQFWTSLNGKEVAWRQRLIPPTGDVTELNWEPQRFDEQFLISNPQVRGITFYWYKPNTPQERSTLPHKLELDALRQQLYIYPQSQKEVVLRVGLPEIVYQKLVLQTPQVECTPKGENYTFTFRDTQQLIEVQVTLSGEQIKNLNLDFKK